MMPPVVRTVEELRATVGAWRARGERVALVPTMGALHEGHLSLLRAGQAEAERTVVSIFVNPTQFSPAEDFSAYPRTFEADRALLATARADLVYAPTAGTIYPQGFGTTVLVGGPAKAGLEDAVRPHFFDGVATVVAKLLTQAMPDLALFGEKDYQQLQVVKRMALDLDLPVRIVGAPTVREPDGLALSSRNVYLTADQRRTAATLPAVLRDAVAVLRTGATAADVLGRGRLALDDAGFLVDYLDLRDALSLAPRADATGAPARVLAAARLGSTRLIDNWAVPIG